VTEKLKKNLGQENYGLLKGLLVAQKVNEYSKKGYLIQDTNAVSWEIIVDQRGFIRPQYVGELKIIQKEALEQYVGVTSDFARILIEALKTA